MTKGRSRRTTTMTAIVAPPTMSHFFMLPLPL
jgi:hypothetical protein